jgi:hypothetical protein
VHPPTCADAQAKGLTVKQQEASDAGASSCVKVALGSSAGKRSPIYLVAPKAPGSLRPASSPAAPANRAFASAGILRSRDVPAVSQCSSPADARADATRSEAFTGANPGAPAASPGGQTLPSQRLSGRDRPQQHAAQDVLESAAYQAHIKAWHDLLVHYRKNPATLGFSYLVQAQPDAVVPRPYDLLVVPHSKVQREYYYTMSAKGLTFFHGAETSHISLDEFEGGFLKYRQVARIRFFANFRQMKAFRVWHACITRTKAKAAKQALSSRLFHMHPCFGPCLRELVRKCEMLKGEPLLAILQADQPGDLKVLKVRLRSMYALRSI